PATTVTVPNVPGPYVFRLTASDGQLTSSGNTFLNVNPPNQPPVISNVSIVPAQFIALPANTITITNKVTDDGLPSGTVNIPWIQLIGPAPVVFSAPNQPATQVTFSAPGSYVVEMVADDTQLRSTFQLNLSVQPQNQAPVVSAGPNQSIALPANTVSLVGSVSDDGLPSGSSLTQQWSEVSGPAAVDFSTPTSTTTQATFPVAGTYDLRLTASDTQLTGSADAIITVLPAPQNLPPVVSAGLNHTATLPGPNSSITALLSHSA